MSIEDDYKLLTAKYLALISREPIYPVEVINAACRTLEVAAALATSRIRAGQEVIDLIDDAGLIAARIIRDGLLSHEKVIKKA